MNPQIGRLVTNVSAFLDQNCRPPNTERTSERKKLDHISDLEPWDPPFERWLRLADYLLRDWPSRARVSKNLMPIDSQFRKFPRSQST